jgi:hypothetical protein
MKVSSQIHGHFTPVQELSIPTGQEAGWPQSQPRRCEEDKNFYFRRESNLESSVIQPVA